MTADEQAYFIRASAAAPVQGPFARSRIKAYVASGRVNASMEFSKDGKEWWPGATWQAVFPEPSPVRPPPPPPPQPPPAPAPRRGQAAVPTRSRGGNTRRPAPNARARRATPDPQSERAGPGGRPRRRRPNPALLWAGVLIVVGGSAALLYYALAPSQAEQDIERIIALMEERCEIMEGMSGGEVDLEQAARLFEINGELQALRRGLEAARVTRGSKAKYKQYERRISELGERLKRATARLQDPDDPTPPLR